MPDPDGYKNDAYQKVKFTAKVCELYDHKSIRYFEENMNFSTSRKSPNF